MAEVEEQEVEEGVQGEAVVEEGEEDKCGQKQASVLCTLEG